MKLGYTIISEEFNNKYHDYMDVIYAMKKMMILSQMSPIGVMEVAVKLLVMAEIINVRVFAMIAKNPRNPIKLRIT